ncbi:hypothetical protein DXG03_004841 [Asterophora parasitica]|uniref:GST N-terminal domain-containing protein n=1 Tax=Asterophora parasitica TaxID=117018 RepID=A0A9P7G6A0_9AGAR|nr:hypothetical protein DXG03_004841 [Asterophora parasitica]
MASNIDTGKQYHTAATGPALDTVQCHQEAQEITLFGSCFCPFVQRVWVAFEALGVPYKAPNFLFMKVEIDEVDPYKKPQDLLEVSPKGLVPGLKLHTFNPPRGLNESTVILEYLEEYVLRSSRIVKFEGSQSFQLVSHDGQPKPPPDPRQPVYLQAQSAPAQIVAGKEFHAAIAGLVDLFERTEREILGAGGEAGEGERRAARQGLGLWVEGGKIGWGDVMAGPWVFRASNVLKHYRGFEMPKGIKFEAWCERMFKHPAFRATCSSEQLYLDSYERRVRFFCG